MKQNTVQAKGITFTYAHRNFFEKGWSKKA